ncbi:MAG: hypothetical protein ACKVH8_16460 [Pirellulales bacterium]
MSTTTLSTELSPEVISYVCTLVLENSAIELDSSKSYMIEARLKPLAKHHGFETISDFIRDLISTPRLSTEAKVVEAIITNETSFYRDVHPFEALKKTILPDVI